MDLNVSYVCLVMVINIYNRNNRGQNVKVLMLIGKYFVLIISFKLGVSGFRIPRNPELAEARVLAFLGTTNPVGCLAPDVPKPGFQGTGTET